MAQVPSRGGSTVLDTTGGHRATPGFQTSGSFGTPNDADPDLQNARAELRRQDDYYANERVKWGIRWFFVLWLGSLTLDAIVCFGLGLGDFTAAALHRLVPLPFAAWFAYRVDHGPLLPESSIHPQLILGNTTIVVWLSLTVLSTGGLTSIYQLTLLFVPLTMIIVPTTFTRSVLTFSLELVTYVVVVLASVAFDDDLHHQLHDTEARMAFAFFSFAFFGMGATMSVVSHLLWSLRREVFESKSIGKYSLRRLLGRGGMGEVWAAYHSGLRREVALKLLGVRDRASPIAARRFEREVQALVRLSHPNTVRVFDFGVAEGGLLYYAMELLEGDNLGRLVRREGALPQARAKHFLVQAARALAEAHQRGIVHRDVKPENLFITDAGGEGDFLKILDFGIATIVESDDSKLTQTGTVTGTPGTVSPEVIRGEPATPAADVYALGAVAYLMLTGALPFEGEKVGQLMLAHLHDAPTPPGLRREEPISPAFEALVLRCLEKDPATRFHDAHELVLALLAVTDVPTWVPPQLAPGQRRSLPQPAALNPNALAETDEADEGLSDEVASPAEEEDAARSVDTRALPTLRSQRPPPADPS